MDEMAPYSLIEREVIRHRVPLMPRSIDSAQVASQSSSEDNVTRPPEPHTQGSLRSKIGR
jgi:hypothetical protein